jgi:hypothetical protein
MNSNEVGMGEGVEDDAEVRGVCDREGVVENVKNEFVDVDVDEREVGGVRLGESGMTRGERWGRLRPWVF